MFSPNNIRILRAEVSVDFARLELRVTLPDKGVLPLTGLGALEV